MVRILTSIIIMGMFGLSALPAAPIHAQAGDSTITLSEAEINAAIAENQSRFERFSGMTVDLQPDTVVLSGSYGGQRGNTFNAELVLIPQYVDDNFAGWAVDTFTLTGTAIAGQGVDTVLTNLFMGTWRAFESATFTPNNDIIRVTITDDSITYVFADAVRGPLNGTLDLVNGTLTYAEAELNAAADAARDRAPEAIISNQYIDLQPGQVVITALATPDRSDVGEVYVTAIFSPTVADGRVDWELVSFEGFEASTRVSFDDARAAIEAEWENRAMTALDTDYVISGVIITETELIYSFDS